MKITQSQIQKIRLVRLPVPIMVLIVFLGLFGAMLALLVFVNVMATFLATQLLAYMLNI